MLHHEASGARLGQTSFPPGCATARHCLLTFCHPIPSRLALAIYRFDAHELDWIEFPELSTKLAGAYGICAANGLYYVLLQLQANASCLAVLNQDLVPVQLNPLPKTRDGHSLLWHEGRLYVASTATNRIMRLTLDDHQRLVAEEECWVYDAADQDTVHLNSLAVLNGHLYATLFGRGTGKGWRQHDQGMVIDVTSNEPVAQGLFHPHSLRALNGSLYVAESRRGRILVVAQTEGSWKQSVLCEVPGYVRGLTTDGQYLYVGISSSRRKSKSTGRLHRPPGESREDMHCRLLQVNPQTGTVITMDLTPWAREVYDIELLPRAPAGATEPAEPWSLIRRLQEYDRQHFELLYTHDRVADELLAYNQGLRQLIEVQQDYEAALAILTPLLSRNPEQAEWHYLAGVCLHFLRKDPQRALEHYTAALAHGFDEFWVVCHRGQLHLELANCEQAEADLRRALLLRPGYEAALALLQELYAGVGRVAQASSYSGADTDVYKNTLFRIEQGATNASSAYCCHTSYWPS